MTAPELKRDLLLTLLLAAAAASLGLFTGWIAIDTNRLSSSIQAELDELSSRTILGYTVYGEGKDAVVVYSYVGDLITGLLAPDELLEKRTSSSWTRLIGYEHKGTAQEKMIATLVSYPQDAFTQQPDGWHYIEYAETTQEAMQEHEKGSLVAALFWNVAHAADFYAGSGDGYVLNNSTTSDCDTSSLWNTIRTATAGSTADSTSVSLIIGAGSANGKFPSCNIYRGFLPFDTSTIPVAATITAASLNTYVTASNDLDNDGNDFITVVQTTQATHTTLATGDYDQCGAVNSPTEGIATGDRKDITSISTSAYLSFPLNTTGQGWIKKSGQSSVCSATAGITCLGLREGHDVNNSTITVNTTNTLTVSTSEETGTGNDPYLSVTYSTGSFAFWQFQDF